MKITNQGPADTEISRLVNNDKSVTPARRDADSKVSQGGASAKVDISKEARDLQRIAELASKGDELRAEKTSQIKEQVAKGQYDVVSQDVAADIVRSEVARLFEKK